MSLLPAAERQQRQVQKPKLVLRFLRDTIYSNADLLGNVIGISHRSHTLQFLRKMESHELIRHHDFAALGGFTLWGITATGQHSCLEHGEEANPSVFNPSKVSIVNLFHYLAMQHVHIGGSKAGWNDFVYVDRYRTKHLGENNGNSNETRPDLLAINPHGHKAAIEVELTRKAENRYRDEIIPGHVRNLNAKQYAFVLWVTANENDQQELYGLFQRVYRELKETNKWHLDIPPTPFKTFQFANLKAWPNG